MEFRPCIDIHNGRVKQIVGSTLTDGEKAPSVNFESSHSPSYYANLYREHNLKGGHVIKLGPNNEDAALEALESWPDGMQIGGGVNPNNALLYINSGASHVIVTSYVFKDGKIDFNNLEKLVKVVGKDRLVLDLSCKERDGEYYIVTDRWQNWTDVKISKETLELLGSYCDELLVHAASVEGKMQGPDLNLVKILSDYSPVGVTYAGGITTMEDLEDIKSWGKDRVHITVGSALDLFGGNLSFLDVVKYCS